MNLKKKSGKTSSKKTKELFWVGIGASAGGLEALKTLAINLPKEGQMTYIIVQHLSPTHKSMLVDLIARETLLDVQEVTDGLLPKANTIYVTPSNHEIFVKSNRLFLKNSSNKAVPKPSINFFFDSLANEKGHNAIGIILSGSGSDGSHGIRSIKAGGGITIAQDEKTAKYFSMPDAAIKTECIDLVLAPQDIAKKLPQIISTPRMLLDLHMDNPAENDIFFKFFKFLKRYSGVDFSEYKKGTILRRIERRMAAHGIHDIVDYLDMVQKNSDEVENLFKDLLISVTSFFRDKEAFAALETHIEKIVTKHDGQNIRIWVPGCATGEEVYTLAILFAEAMGAKKFAESKLVIFATDIDSSALAMARKGSYPIEITNLIAPGLLNKYFDIHTDFCVVKKILKNKIVFSRHDIISEPPFSKINLVSCRNLFIYFNNELQNKVFQILHYSLCNDGILFLGKSESVGEADDYFATMDSNNKIFVKKPSIDISSTIYPSVLKTRFQNIQPSKQNRTNTSIQSVAEKLISIITPCSILYDEKLNIRQVFGDIQPFVEIAEGEITTNIMGMLQKPIAQEIHALTYRSLNDNHPVESRSKEFTLNSVKKKMHMIVYPVFSDSEYEKMFLASFVFDKTSNANKKEEEITDQSAERIQELEHELNSTQEYLQTVVEELETSNEELQSLNEELQSANEELQSANEELETSNEELQSTNEELSTVNDEIQSKSSDLEEINDYLVNIKDSVNIGIILLDSNMNILLLNKAGREVFTDKKEFVGQNILFQPLLFSIPDFKKKIGSVIERGENITESIMIEEKFYVLNIIPFIKNDLKVSGAILTFFAVQDEFEYYQLIEGIYKDGIWDWPDVEQDPEYWSPQWKRLLGYGEHEIQASASKFFELLHPDDQKRTEDLVKAHLKKDEPFDTEYRLRTKSGKYKWFRGKGIARKNKHTGKTRMLGFISDIDQFKNASIDLARSELTKQTFIEASYDGFWDWHIQDDYEYMSPRFWEMFGYDPAEKEHRPSEWQKIITGDSLKLALANFDKHVRSKGVHPYSQEVEYKHKDGHSVFVLCRGQVIEWDEKGKPIRMVGTHTDITDLKLSALNKDKKKG